MLSSTRSIPRRLLTNHVLKATSMCPPPLPPNNFSIGKLPARYMSTPPPPPIKTLYNPTPTPPLKGETSIDLLANIAEQKKKEIPQVLMHIGSPATIELPKYPYASPMPSEEFIDAATRVANAIHQSEINQKLTPVPTNSAKNTLDLYFRFVAKKQPVAVMIPGYGPTHTLATINQTPLKYYDAIEMSGGKIEEINHPKTIDIFIDRLEKDTKTGEVKHVLWQPFTIGFIPTTEQCKRIAKIVNKHNLGFIEERLYAETRPKDVSYRTPLDYINIGMSPSDPPVVVSYSGSKLAIGGNGGNRVAACFSNIPNIFINAMNLTSTSVSQVALKVFIDESQKSSNHIENRLPYVEHAKAAASKLKENGIQCSSPDINGFVIADLNPLCKHLNITGNQLQKALYNCASFDLTKTTHSIFTIQGSDILLNDPGIFRLSFLGCKTIEESINNVKKLLTLLNSKHLEYYCKIRHTLHTLPTERKDKNLLTDFESHKNNIEKIFREMDIDSSTFAVIKPEEFSAERKKIQIICTNEGIKLATTRFPDIEKTQELGYLLNLCGFRVCINKNFDSIETALQKDL